MNHGFSVYYVCRCATNFRQNGGNLSRLDTVDRLAPENFDLLAGPRRDRTPSLRIGRPENYHAGRAGRRRQMRYAGIVADKGARAAANGGDRKQIEVLKDRNAG